jgi:hypothetical protein
MPTKLTQNWIKWMRKSNTASGLYKNNHKLLIRLFFFVVVKRQQYWNSYRTSLPIPFGNLNLRLKRNRLAFID